MQGITFTLNMFDSSQGQALNTAYWVEFISKPLAVSFNTYCLLHLASHSLGDKIQSQVNWLQKCGIFQGAVIKFLGALSLQQLLISSVSLKSVVIFLKKKLSHSN